MWCCLLLSGFFVVSFLKCDILHVMKATEQPFPPASVYFAVKVR